jgi:hypothetical protein
MSEESGKEQPALSKKAKTQGEKQVEHIERIKRTLTACLLGMLTGVLSFVSGGTADAHGLQNNGLLALMLMLAGIVMQKHIFMLMGMDTSKLGGKDWFYQGFMTFALWFMTWTILLSSFTPVAGFSANITSAQAPMAVTFVDISTGSPTTWSWEFGDGTTASVQNPVHLYTTSGVFTVSLTVSSAHGSTTKTVRDFISANSTISQ